MESQSESSERLILAAQAGDRAALEALLRLHRAGVYRYGLQVCRSSEDAEDAVQLTLWAATRSLSTFRRAASVTTWLFTIVHNYCHRLLHLGRRDISLEPFTFTLSDTRPLADDALDARKLQQLLADAVAELDPLSREAIVLRDIQGLTAPEAARALRITVPALKSRLHRGREQLRERIEAQLTPA